MIKESLKKIVVGSSAFVMIVSLLVYFVLVRNGSSYSEFCTESQVKPKVEDVFFRSFLPPGSEKNLKVVIDTVNEISLNG